MGCMEPVAGFERFFDTAERLVADLGPAPAAFARLGDLLRMLAADRALIDESKLDALHQSSAQATILGYGPTGSTLMLSRFSAEAPTPVHNHNSWGVLCVVRGRDRRDGIGDRGRNDRHRSDGRGSQHLQGGQRRLLLSAMLHEEPMVPRLDGGTLGAVGG